MKINIQTGISVSEAIFIYWVAFACFLPLRFLGLLGVSFVGGRALGNGTGPHLY